MTNFEAQRRFYDFARMRLEGKSDETYRAYDLLSKERKPANLRTYFVSTGIYMPNGQSHQALLELQSHFKMWGFEKTLGEIETLLHEYWVYKRIRWHAKKNWPLRSGEESRDLYEQDQKARGQTTA